MIYMRLPNGYGSVHKLSGKRRNPWAVRKTSGWDIKDGKLIRSYVYVGYYPNKAQALQALAEYNANPFEIRPDLTFAEVYDKWSERKFEEISRSNINGYNAAYNLCSALHNIKFADIKLVHLQTVIDKADKNYPTLKKVKVLFNQLFDYAVMNEIISKDKHIVEYVNIGKAEKSDLHYRFTNDEIDTMWKWSAGNEYIQVILMLIYSGVRPGELFNVKKSNVNLDEKSIYIEKGKTANATRKVPIHDRVFPFYEYWMEKDTEYLIAQINGKKINFESSHKQYTETYWKPLLQDMGIYQYKNERGEIKEHTPDDTRHTFTTMWKEKHLDEAMRRKIQGHSGQGIGEMVYTHYEFEKLREEMNKL